LSSFDAYSESYSDALASGLRVSGESQEFFAKGRIDWVARRIEKMGFRPQSVLDFGCGQGSSTSLLLDAFGASSAVGVDVSLELLKLATSNNADARVSYSRIDDFDPTQSFDIAYTNGVFHHIVPSERASAVDYVFRSLKPGGLFALWENNPWNPGTRLIMKKIPFDRDAQLLGFGAARALVENAGFTIATIDSTFFFPRMLKKLRGLEAALSPTRLGAQYLILCRKPSS
jgi:trans-aconitate methyltransferase